MNAILGDRTERFVSCKRLDPTQYAYHTGRHGLQALWQSVTCSQECNNTQWCLSNEVRPAARAHASGNNLCVSGHVRAIWNANASR